MKTDTLKRVTKQIVAWRKEMDNSTVQLEVNENLLQTTLKALDKLGLSEGLAVYIILDCEWAFRIKQISETEVQNLLGEIEHGLGLLRISERAIIHIVKALEPSIRKTIEEEKRLPIAFPSLPPSDMEMMIRDENYRPRRQQEALENRLKPKQLIPVRPGPSPWLSPWITGCLINLYLSKKRIRKTSLILDLMSALLNRPSIEESDFRKREKSFGAEKLEEFLKQCQEEYEWFLGSEEGTAQRENRPLKSWEDLLLINWNEKNGNSVFGGSVCPAFGCQLELVQEFIGNYSTTGKRKTQTGRKK